MGLLDKLKSVVTGGAARVELVAIEGTIAPAATLRVRVRVTALEALASKGCFIDLHGEDDLEESVFQKAAELFDPDPEYTYPLTEAFALASGESKVVSEQIVMPTELPAERTWLFRARVEAPGKDPASAWQTATATAPKAD
jgi:hypothetical protein